MLVGRGIFPCLKCAVAQKRLKNTGLGKRAIATFFNSFLPILESRSDKGGLGFYSKWCGFVLVYSHAIKTQNPLLYCIIM